MGWNSACHARAIPSPALSRYEEVMPQRPILYSFRRCPYAIRARLALLVSRQTVELREVVLRDKPDARSEEHTSELQSLMRISYAVFCLKKKKYSNYILDE